MLRVTIEVLPGGDESRARTLRTLTITNVGPSFKHADWHGYEVTMTRPDRAGGKTTWFDHRREDGVEKCVALALEALTR